MYYIRDQHLKYPPGNAFASFFDRSSATELWKYNGTTLCKESDLPAEQ